MRLVLSTALVLAAAGVYRPGCGKTPPEAPRPCILVPVACAGRACGAECTTGGGCDGAPSAPGRCDADGECIESPGPPPACGPSAECAGAACGAACDRCAGACATPVAGACDYAGWCVSADLPWLCYDPCAGKPCGARCDACPPNTPSCVETGVEKACDAGGHCVAGADPLACGP